MAENAAVPALFSGGPLASAADIRARAAQFKEYVVAINEFVESQMEEDVDFGVIPGTERKDKQGNVLPKDKQRPTIYKPGVLKLDMLFGLVPNFIETRRECDLDRAWFYIEYQTDMMHNGVKVAEGRGAAHSLETKWGFRIGGRKCPKCGEQTIFKSKRDGGWFCWEKKGGCGEQFPGDDPAIMDQEVGRVQNEAWADSMNTIIKQAMIRAHREGTLAATALSNRFTQDIGEEPPEGNTPYPSTAPYAPEENEPPHTTDRRSAAPAKPAMLDKETRELFAAKVQELMPEATDKERGAMIAKVGKATWPDYTDWRYATVGNLDTLLAAIKTELGKKGS